MNLMETLENPSLLHAAVVHFPIVLFTFAVPVAALALLFQRHAWLHLANALLFILLVASCVVAEQTGELAFAKVPAQFDQAVWDQVNEHEAMASLLKFVAAAGALMAALALIPLPPFRVGGALVSLCVALGGLFMTMLAAHYGGDLVYRYGVGTHVVEEQVRAQVQAAGARAASGAVAPRGEDVEEKFLTLKPIDLEAAEKVSFAKDVWPILEARCLSCHDVDDPDGSYVVRTVADLMKPGEKSGPGVIPGKPDDSSVVKYITGELQPRMPKKKKPLPENELDTIRMWIAAGARDDSNAAPAPVPAPEAAAPAPVTVTISPAPTPEPEAAPLTAPTPASTEMSEAPASPPEPAAETAVMELAPAEPATPQLAEPAQMEAADTPSAPTAEPAPPEPYDPFGQ